MIQKIPGFLIQARHSFYMAYALFLLFPLNLYFSWQIVREFVYFDDEVYQ